MPNPVYVQEDFRFRKDDGTLATATYEAALNTDITMAQDTVFRLRAVVRNDATNKDATGQTFHFYCSRNSGTYFRITATSTVIQLADDANSIADHATTVQRIGDGTYTDGDSPGYNDGTTDDDTGAVTIEKSSEFETEHCMKVIGEDVSDDDTLDFRVYRATVALNTYLSTPRLTVGSGAAAESILADNGSFLLSGQAAGVLAQRKSVGSYGSFLVTGQSVGLIRGAVLGANYGGFVLTGQDADLVLVGKIIADYGGFLLAGQDAHLYANRYTTGGYGAFALTGQSAGLLTARKIAAGYGNYQFFGQDAVLRAARLSVMEHGGFTLTGQAAALIANRLMALGYGVFILNGQDVQFIEPTAPPPIIFQPRVGRRTGIGGWFGGRR